MKPSTAKYLAAGVLGVGSVYLASTGSPLWGWFLFATVIIGID